MMDAGMVTLCTLEDRAQPGNLPREMLVPGDIYQFEERTVGSTRFYAAAGANQQIDMLIRTWRNQAHIGMYAVLTDYEGQENVNGDQYRIENVQQLRDRDGLKVTDLTLKRMDKLYEVFAE